MQKILNITNGDSAVEIMKAAKLAGAFLPWRDVLHDGPVPDNISMESLSTVRARFIAQRGWGESKQVLRSFTERDNKLKSCGQYDKVILWFEHDLYDQLQILQILDWMKSHPLTGTAVSMICTEKYLGMLSPEEIKDLIKYERPIEERHLKLAGRAWSAFRSNTPVKWCALLQTDTDALPFLRPAVIRMLEEYPSCSNGLSRTAQQALKIISEGESRPARIFTRSQALEERIFLGDASFWNLLHTLLDASPPLLRLPAGVNLTLPDAPGQKLTLTATGRKVLAGEITWLEVVEMDRWIGGVHLRPGTLWCWDPALGGVRAPS